MTAIDVSAGSDRLDDIWPEVLAALRHDDVQVTLGPGRHDLVRTLSLAPEPSFVGRRLAIRGTPGSTVISGGRRVSEWTEREPGLFAAPLPGLSPRAVFVDGHRYRRPRSIPTFRLVRTDEGYEASHDPGWSRPDEVELVIRHEWMEHRLPVHRLEGRSIVMGQPAFRNVRWQMGDAAYDHVRFVDNAREDFNEPGTFFVDTTAGELLVRLRSGDTLADVVVPVVEATLLDVVGIEGSTGPLVELSGLGFEYSAWNLELDGERGLVEIQANYAITGDNRGYCSLNRVDTEQLFSLTPIPAAVSLAHASVVVTECRFERLGGVGLRLGDGVHDSVVEGTVFRDIAGTAVQVGGISSHHAADDATTRDIVVQDCVITDSPCEYHAGVGIMVGFGQRIVIQHNLLADLPYTGISTGWGWTYLVDDQDPPTNRDICVLANRIDRPNRILRDGGAIYNLGPQPGMLVHGNVISHTDGVFPAAIYLDEGSSGIDLRDNVIVGSRGRPIHFHWNTGNLITANYFDTPRHTSVKAWDNRVEHGEPIRHLSDVPEVVTQAGPRAPWSALVETTDIHVRESLVADGR